MNTTPVYPSWYDEYDYNPDEYFTDIEEPPEEDYAFIEQVLFSDEIDEEEILRCAGEYGVYRVSADELLEFSTAAELKIVKQEEDAFRDFCDEVSGWYFNGVKVVGEYTPLKKIDEEESQ